ncbi:arylsulfatase [Stratiformator vulcanicus]|uniref:Arylsulfatase n=1 Tax=Stratiformator vulcanicus TaxID=2527980 RepID=A0A517QYJ9_9PLAN|nr:arylsulfatase [Stratiformator vulcanicus]QDT36668.1 Arylsulfatase [Stratiformator vulcanicus]
MNRSLQYLSAAVMFLPGMLTNAAAADDRPNVIYIMADDLGYADLGCYGSEIETPVLDQLAAEGLRLRQFYNTAKCHSSRVCLLTGLYCGQAGDEAMNRGVTIAEVARQAGYSTQMSGKWHLRKQPTDRGFDRYYGHLSGATNFFTGDDTFRLNGKKWDDFGPDYYTTDAITDYALTFLDQARQEEKPYLLYVAYNAPHYPLQAPEEDVKKYRGRYSVGWDRIRADRHQRQVKLGIAEKQWGLSPRPKDVKAWEDLTDEQQDWEDFRMATYAAMVDRMDRNIGRLIADLKSNGEIDNTLIVFCSDNGACPFERTRGKQYQPWDSRSYWTYDKGWAHVGNTPFRLYKQNQHEGGISSPCIVHWPNGLKTDPGSISDQPAHLIDLMATLVDVAGAEYPTSYNDRAVEPLQGETLRPIFAGKEREPHEWLYFQFSTNRAIRRGDLKLVTPRAAPWELYDVAKDRTEMHNLIDKNAGLAAELKELWYDIAENVDQLSGKMLKPVRREKRPADQ